MGTRYGHLRWLIGSDIEASVRTVVTFCDNPGKAHWSAVLQIIQYLLRTKDWESRLGARR